MTIPRKYGQLKTKLANIKDKLYPLAAFALIVVIWLLVLELELVPAFMLPYPSDVVRTLVQEFDILMGHMLVSLYEAGLGLVLGIGIGFVLAVLMDKYRVFYKIFYPLIVFSQTVPTIAIAPLIVLWLGYGVLPKVVLVILTTFYPMAIGLYEGFRSVDEDKINLMKSMGASDFQIFRFLKLPSSMVSFFASLKISVSYAIVAAVVAEWLGGSSGLGVYMTRVRKGFMFDKMFAVIIIISALSLVLMSLVSLLRRKIVKWEYIDEK